jgi:catechol 2,3-dioxygenase-like lactoylglutathione lyase family enzyme
MSSIVHFEIPVDDLQRAKTFYSNIFGWKFEGVQGMDYMIIDTYGLGVGMVKRMQPDQQIFVQIGGSFRERILRQSREARWQDHCSKEGLTWNGLFCDLYGH